jgi:cytoskeletal protein CcmA (bactofilin family)
MPLNQPPAPSTLAREGIPMNTLPARSYEAEPSRGSAAGIGKSVVIKGQLFSREDLYIDGEVEGSVEMLEHRLTVGPNGRIVAGVKAREVVVIGTVHGNIESSDKVEIRKGAKVVGDIRTVRIVIEDEAFFKGSIDQVKPEPKPQPRPAPAAATAPAPQQPSSAATAVGESKG